MQAMIAVFASYMFKIFFSNAGFSWPCVQRPLLDSLNEGCIPIAQPSSFGFFIRAGNATVVIKPEHVGYDRFVSALWQ